MNSLNFYAALLAALPLLKSKDAIGADNNWKPISGQTKKSGTAGTRQTNLSAAQEVEYRNAINLAAKMTRDHRTAKLVRKHGLSITNITWEDTARYKNSSVGPNISDMSIQVGVKNDNNKYDLSLMPVIRYDNFTDLTADVDPSAFTLLVGNEKGEPLKRVSLKEFLEDPTRYLHNRNSWLNPKKSLYAPSRDSRVLVSAQASFLPVPPNGKAEFNPVIFNYQSISGDPAVLTILVTRQGTSTTVIDNKRDSISGGGWGQRLFHNQNGQRAILTGQRMSDFLTTDEGNKSTKGRDRGKVEIKKSSGLNMVLLIQVPLKQKTVRLQPEISVPDFGEDDWDAMNDSAVPASVESDVEAAVIGHGNLEGPYTEIDNLSIERDERFPVRVTVQFYKATATGVADEADIKQIKEEIDSVLDAGDTVGSLVVSDKIGRITEYDGVKVQSSRWWNDFWKRHEENTGEARAKASVRLQKLLGQQFLQKPVCELYVANLLSDGNPPTPKEILKEAEALQSKKKFSEIIALLTKAGDRPFKPFDDAKRHFLLGHSYGQLKQYDKAIEFSGKARELDSNLYLADYNIACYTALQGNYDKALLYLFALVESLEEDASEMSRRAQVLLRYVMTDPDLKRVRDMKQFQRLKVKLEKMSD